MNLRTFFNPENQLADKNKLFLCTPIISKKCISYCKNPTQDKKHGTCPQNPTAGPQTYWAAHVLLPQQFAALVSNLKGVSSTASLLFQLCFKGIQKVFHKGEFLRYFKIILRMFPACFRWD